MVAYVTCFEKKERFKMIDDIFIDPEEWRCEEKCALIWVDCMESEGGAHICKTIENECYEDCNCW